MIKRKIKVAIGISGGVDSAVAAALLKKQGYEVVGVHLYCYDEGSYCTAPEDRASAVRVVKHLGIPLLVWDFRKQYKERVIKYFFEEYRAGRTPNPDVVCNREIKFGLFLEKALKELKVNYVATGHYARIARGDKQEVISNKQEAINHKKNRSKNLSPITYHLLRGVDETKDQSYFLYTLTQKQIEHILFPIGEYRKAEVRKMAEEFGLPNYSRGDSMGVCFIGPVPIAKFLRENLPSRPGAVVDSKGEIIGEHDGVWFFTEGQRHGFRIFRTAGLPLYVIGKDVTTNTLTVGRGEETKVRQFEIEKPHWIGEQRGKIKKQKLEIRIRHLGEIMPAAISPADGKLLATLAEPAFGVAPGQSAVFYRREELLGGGVISNFA